MSTPRGNRREFRFRARYRLFARGMLALGAVFVAAPWVMDVDQSGAIVGGAVAMVLASLYLVSPAWRIVVVIDDDGLAVLRGTKQRFRLAWDEVVRVKASPGTQTCFVDGGEPERSLMVPGRGAPAPYVIEDRAALYAEIVSRVRADVVEEVEFLVAFGKPELKE